MSSWSSICSLCVLPAFTHSPLSIHTATWWLPALPWCLQMVPILLPLVTAITVPRAKVSDSPLPPFLSPCPSLSLSHLYTFTPPVPLEHLATFQVRTHFLLLEKTNQPSWEQGWSSLCGWPWLHLKKIIDVGAWEFVSPSIFVTTD